MTSCRLPAVFALVTSVAVFLPSVAQADETPAAPAPKPSKKKPAAKKKKAAPKPAEPTIPEAIEAPKETPKEAPKAVAPVTLAAPAAPPRVVPEPNAPASTTSLTSADVPGRDAPAESKKTTPDAPSPWLFDGSVGVPKLASGAFSLAFDVTGGYTGEHLAGSANFAMSTMSMQEGNTLSSTGRTRFGVDANYLTSPGPHRFEASASLGYASYQTSYLSMGDGTSGSNASPGFSAEGSGLMRASAMAGVRAQESDVLQWRTRAGVGIQSESYSRVSSGNTPGNGSGDANGSFSAATSVRFSAHAEARWRVMPDLVALRPELGASMFSIRRSAFFFGATQNSATLEDSRAIELSLRANAEIEKLAMFGFVPALFAGLDYANVSGDAGTTSTLIPLGGIALATTSPL